MNRNINALIIVIWLMPVVLLGWLVYAFFVPLGTYTVMYEVGKENPQITNFASKETENIFVYPKNNAKNGVSQLITKSPLYFDVETPRPFQKAAVIVRYQNPEYQPVMQLGVQQSNESYAFTDLAHEHPVLESLPDEWEKLEKGDLVLWQKNNDYLKARAPLDARKRRQADALERELKQRSVNLEKQLESGVLDEEPYRSEIGKIDRERKTRLAEIDRENTLVERPSAPFSSVDDFLTNQPSPSVTLQYNYNLIQHAKIHDYVPSTTPLVLKHVLRGSHEIYTYLGEGEALSFALTIRSINRHPGKDRATARVFNLDQQVMEVRTDEMGSRNADGIPSPETKMLLNNAALPAGVYRIVLTMHDDLFLTRLETGQRLLMFRNGIYLTNNKEYASVLGNGPWSPTTLLTTSHAVSASTSHVNSLQTLSVGQHQLKLTELLEEKTTPRLKGVSTIVSPANDVRLSGDGYFAFSAEQLFALPDGYDTFTAESDLRRYDYIFARYPQPKREGKWRVAQATVDTPPLYFKDSRVRFILTFPGMPEAGRAVRIQSIRINLSKPPLRLSEIFPRIVTKLRSILQ
ncbi:MAG: hypothetical protein HY566_02865 [Candidatus Kerfeldbacteria bacterium]|nr:hypothetical protein [Candidatus Kerfeldbacteria bacterium]